MNFVPRDSTAEPKSRRTQLWSYCAVQVTASSLSGQCWSKVKSDQVEIHCELQLMSVKWFLHLD